MRRNGVAGIFPNKATITRFAEALLLEQSGDWAVQCAHCVTLQTIAPIGDSADVSLPVLAV